MLQADVRMTSDLRQSVPQSGEMSLARLSSSPELYSYGSFVVQDMKNDTNISPQTCADLVCFIWFAETSALPPLQPSSSRTGQLCADSKLVMLSNRENGHHPAVSNEHQNYYHAALPSPSRTIPSKRFSAFVNNILKTTQVSDSIIKLSLYYIYCLKVRNFGLHGQLGSEYRLFLTSLILANKFLDDCTYTNKTWSDVSHTPLYEITKMEMQLFAGIGTNANLNADKFRRWCATLDVLVVQRERDLHLLKLRESPASGTFPSPPLTTVWSSTSSPTMSPVLTPHCNPAVPNHYTRGEPILEAQSLKKRKRSLQSELSDSEDVHLSKRRLFSSLNGENLVQIVADSTMGLTRTPNSDAPPYSNKDCLIPMSTGFFNDGLESDHSKPCMRCPFSGQTYFSGDRMSINGNVSTMSMTAQELPLMALDAGISPYGKVLSKSMPTPELYWMLDLSPNAFVTQTSPLPRKLGYYQLASGYPYGIHAIMTSTPNTNFPISTDQTNEAIMPPHLDMHVAPGVLQASNILNCISKDLDIQPQF